MKRFISLLLSVLILVSLVSLASKVNTPGLYVHGLAFDGSRSQHYTDLDHKAWYYTYAESLINMGVMTGIDETLFSPSVTLTRAMFATVLYRRNIALVMYERQSQRRFDDPFLVDNIDCDEIDKASGLCAVSDEDGLIFSDVLSGKWYSEAVKWAASRGVIMGYPDGTFQPNSPITREEVMTILARYHELYADKYEPTKYIIKMPLMRSVSRAGRAMRSSSP